MSLLGRAMWGLRRRIARLRLERRWRQLRRRGLNLGADVWLPRSTWIDPDFCFLISIGDHCGFGEGCLILAHDAQMDEFLDGARVGHVIIRESSHIGARTTILPGVEIGPRTIVGANSVVSASLPADSVCGGNPARVLCSLGEYLTRHRSKMQVMPTLPYQANLDFAERERLRHLSGTGDVYLTGGRAVALRGEGGTPRTGAHPAPSGKRWPRWARGKGMPRCW